MDLNIFDWERISNIYLEMEDETILEEIDIIDEYDISYRYDSLLTDILLNESGNLEIFVDNKLVFIARKNDDIKSMISDIEKLISKIKNYVGDDYSIYKNSRYEVKRTRIDWISISKNYYNEEDETILEALDLLYMNDVKYYNNSLLTDVIKNEFGALEIYIDYKLKYVINSKKDREKMIDDLIKVYCKFGNRQNYRKFDLNIEKEDLRNVESIIFGNISNASTIYGMDKFNTPRGHGFAAEQANHLYDKINNFDFFGGNEVQLVGEDIDPETNRIIKNGADRIVNGVNIQTKYCKTGSECISECFSDGKFRYIANDGSIMKIEVPSDKYDDAIFAMEERIKKGQIPNVTDPKEAKNIIKKGSITYQQAKNIAKAGTIDSIKFDATNGAIISTTVFGISATVEFARSIWAGNDLKTSLQISALTGIRVGGVTFITSVLSAQLARAGLNSALVSSSEAVVATIGPKGAALISNAFRTGSNIYGVAAMKSAAKMLRSNTITGAVSVVILSAGDFYRIFSGKISGKQLFKNLINNTSSVGGGILGYLGGAAVVGAAGIASGGITIVGGLIGTAVGSFISGKVSKKITDYIIEDDVVMLVEIIQKELEKLSDEYLINKIEFEKIVNRLSEVLTQAFLYEMYKSKRKEVFARTILIDIIEDEIMKRKKIYNISEEDYIQELRYILENTIED
ncbi:hypothetical protein [Streptobacillus canis]|uniref:hypothetical protein n=1 Tax=Streptobacillus canis TaxID=2678686 RepID=UPI0012E130AE|nr:hypothetical protein [Streptobacillus canis]